MTDLTPREKEVLHWVEKGKYYGEIGTILGISVHTVKHHMWSIRVKLGANNKVHAVRLYKLAAIEPPLPGSEG